MRKNDNGNSLKRIFTLLLAMVLITSLISPVSAQEMQSKNEVSSDVSEGIIRGINAIEDEKGLFGLDNVDFESLLVGNQIFAYEYNDYSLSALDLCIYPLTVDKKLVAFAIKNNNTDYYQITTNLVNEISSSIQSNESFALVYDKNTCYAYTEDGLKSLHQFSDEYGNGRQKIDRLEDVSNMKEIKLNNFSSDRILGYSDITNTQNVTYRATASDYISCNVSYVPQGSDDEICWAASVACIGNFLRGLNRTAAYVAQCLYGLDYNHSANGSTSMIVLNSIYNNTSYSYYDDPRPGEYFIWNKIFQGKPIFSSWLCGTSHACVIYGISMNSDYIHIMDPSYGMCVGYYDGITYSYTSIGNGYTWELTGYGASIN